MQKIIDFLSANSIGSLATVDEYGCPHVRPWQFMFEQDRKLWFYTDNSKEVFIQLQSNPAIEFCSTSKEGVTVRVSGEVIFGIDKNIKRKMLEENQQLQAIFETPDNPEFEIFYLKHGAAARYDRLGRLLGEKVVF